MRTNQEPDNSDCTPFREHIRIYITPRHVLLDLLYTIILSILIAWFLNITVFKGFFFINLVMSLSFGLSICTMIMVLLWLFKPGKTASFVLLLFMGLSGGTLMGLILGPFLLKQMFSIVIMDQRKDVFQSIILSMTFGIVASYFFYSQARFKVGREEIQQERIQRLSKEKEALEANLRLLQAQIEPHFLFNTLSNILSLIDTDSAKSKSMLMDLIQYLRTSLSRTRHDLIVLDQEMDLIRAYLNILKIRMGERLHFTIEIPKALGDHPFPPMLIQPLVENAVKHGLDPKIEGGEILIKTREKEGFIRIEVSDDGAGFRSDFKGGVGLTNVRERLKLLYGEKGRLIIEENQPRGVRAVIEVPIL
jgi:sensor histidine kinase YesM